MPVDHLIEPLQCLPGVQRDGTQFGTNTYIDSQWCRFYMGLPRKIGGMELVDPGTPELIRNLYNVNKQNSIDIYLGRPSTLDFFNTTLQGITSAETSRTPADFVADDNNMWTFDLYTNPVGSNVITLTNNPISTTNASSLVTVTVPDSSIFRTGQYLTLTGASTTGGLTAEQLNIEAQITIVDGTHYSFIASSDATATAVGGGNIVNLSYYTSITLANNPISTVDMTSVVTVEVPDTSIFSDGQIIMLAGAATTNNITDAQLNVASPITIVDATHYSFVSDGQANATGTAGGNNAIISYRSPITYLLAHAAPNASDINNNVQTNIYAGDITSSSILTPLDATYLPVSSGGIVMVGPYLFMYGNDGVVSYTLTPSNWSTASNVAIAGNKIVKGLETRGGTNTPSVLFWSMDSLVRMTFQGGSPAFARDTIQEDISIMGQNCVVSIYNIYYWVGVDQFYIYNGVVRPLDNDMSRDYFFDNINIDARNKVFGWVNKRYNEIWWHWPKGDATECTDVLIYNYKLNTWYDSVLGRTAACEPNFFPKPLLADSNAVLNQFLPTIPVTVALGNDPLTTTAASDVITVTVPSTAALSNGTIVTILGATGFDTILAGALNVTGPILVVDDTHFTYVAGSAAAAGMAGGGAGVSYTYSIPNNCYGLWQHEKGTDKVLYGMSLAIPSYFETNIKTIFEKNAAEDRNLRSRRIEPDFVQQEAMTLVINYRAFAQSTISSSQTYTFLPGQEVVELAKVDTTQMGRLVSYRFESNVAGGYYQAGKILLNYAPGDYRP